MPEPPFEPAMEPASAVHFADELPSLLAAITHLRDSVATEAASPHSYIFPSAGQADAAARAIYTWESQGKAGPAPQLDRAALRAMVYLRSTETSKISAFLAVNKASLYETSEQALSAFEQYRWIVAFGLCRSLIERISLASAFAEILERFLGKKLAPNESPHDVLIEHGEIITRFLYGTKRDWRKLAVMDFSKSKSKEGDYTPLGNGIVNYEAKSIMSYVDKVDKRSPGTRLVYDILCEFLHPNCGDLFATTLNSASITDGFGTRLLRREIGIGARSLAGQPEFDHVMGKCCLILAKLFDDLPDVHARIDEYQKEAMRRTQMVIRKSLKKNRNLFVRGDICPCMSGRSVSTCCGR